MKNEFVNGTILTDGNNFFAFMNQVVHKIEINIDKIPLINKTPMELKDNMDEFPYIVNINEKYELVPYNKALIRYKAFHKGLIHDDVKYEMNHIYVDLFPNSFIFNDFQFRSVEYIDEIHTIGYPQTGAKDYDYAKVKVWGLIRRETSHEYETESNCMEIIEKLDPLNVLFESIGNNGFNNHACYFIDDARNNYLCRYSSDINNSINCNHCSIVDYGYGCSNVDSSKLVLRCRYSHNLDGCINMQFCRNCICCCGMNDTSSAIFNKVVNVDEFGMWYYKYFKNIEFNDFDKLYEALDPKLIKHLIDQSKVITMDDVEEFRESIKSNSYDLNNLIKSRNFIESRNGELNDGE